jgi:hypothetical protein
LLSSRLTTPLQFGPVLLWLADFYAITWLLLHRLAGAGMQPALERAVLMLLAVPFVLLPVLALWAAWLRRVATDGADLFVGLAYGGEAAVPLAEVRDVGEGRWADLRTVTVTFAQPTRVGRRIRFLAPTRLVVPPDAPHPVVLALRETARAAAGSGPGSLRADA